MILRKKIGSLVIAEANRKANQLGVLNNSITEGEGNVAAFIGELMTIHSLPGAVQWNTYDYDLLYNNFRIEVKSKRTTTCPEDNFSCSVAKYNQTQKCDYYVFTRVIENCRNPTVEDYSVGWVLGVITPEEFYSISTEHKKGDRDPANNFTFTADCNNVSVAQLHDIRTLLH